MATDRSALLLAEMAVTRFCHDLSGAVGAVSNGLAHASGDQRGEAIEIAAIAAREIAARLRLARALWEPETPLEVADLPALADGLPNRARMEFDSDSLADGTLPAAAGRTLLAALVMGAEALRGPGAIVLHGDPARAIMLVIAGEQAAWPGELADLLRDPRSARVELAPHTLPLRLAFLLAAQAGARLSLLLSSGTTGAPPPLLISFGG